MKIATLSDVHYKIDLDELNIPADAVVVVAGDLAMMGCDYEIMGFILQLKQLPNQHKIVVAGNHDFPLESLACLYKDEFEKHGIIYLEDSGIEIEGVKFYGSPWTKLYGGWAFMKPEADLKSKFCKIPEDCDVLITHSPALLFLDQVLASKEKERIGSGYLAAKIETVQPKLHVFGHVHSSYGRLEHRWATGNKTMFCNASICTEKYHPVNAVQVFELDRSNNLEASYVC